MDLGKHPAIEPGHEVTVTERGRIIRCSDFCTDMRMKYGEVIKQDPQLSEEMAHLESRAKHAADANDATEASTVAKHASEFEAKLKQADDLRQHLFGGSEAEWDAALETIDVPRVKGTEKSGHRIDGITVPDPPRRVIDITDLMTDAELKAGRSGHKSATERIHKVMGRKISDIPELKALWDDVKTKMMGGKTAEQLGREKMLELYPKARRAFWEIVRRDPNTAAFLKQHGLELKGKSGAPVAELGPKGKETTIRGNLTDQERRVSLDHIKEKAQGENWKNALDGDNLELMFQNANSWKEIVQVKFKMRDQEE